MNNKDDDMTPDPLLMVASSGSVSDDHELEVMPLPDPAHFLASGYDEDDEDDDAEQETSGRSMVMEPLQAGPSVQSQQSQYGGARKPTQQQVEDVEFKHQSPGDSPQERVATPDANGQQNSFAAEPERKHSKQVKEKKKISPFFKYLLIGLGFIIICIIILAGMGYMMESNRASDQIDLSSIEGDVSLTEDEQTPTEVVLPTPSKPAEKVVHQEIATPEPVKTGADDVKNSPDSELNARVDQITSKLNGAIGKISELNQRVNELSTENAELKEANFSLAEANSKLTSENTSLNNRKPQVTENKSAPPPTKDSKKPTAVSKVSSSPVVTAKAEKQVKKPPYKRPVVKHKVFEAKSQQVASVRSVPNSQVAPFVSAGSVPFKPSYEIISFMNGKVTLKDPSKPLDSQVYSSGSLVPGYGSIAKISDNGCVQFTNGQNLCRR